MLRFSSQDRRVFIQIICAVLIGEGFIRILDMFSIPSLVLIGIGVLILAVTK